MSFIFHCHFISKQTKLVIKMNSKVHKWCAVPMCKNTSLATPIKVFVHVPIKKHIRLTWLKLARRNPNDFSMTWLLYFCENHFDLPNDMENYMEYHVMGSVSSVRMKEGCMNKYFICQPDRGCQTSDTTDQPDIVKKQRKMTLQECEKHLEEKSIVTEQLSSKEIASGSSDTTIDDLADAPSHHPDKRDAGTAAPVLVSATSVATEIALLLHALMIK